MRKPLENLVVLDLSQFLAGPAAALRLADLGARVIKVERPGPGDLCRRLYISNLELDGDSTLFHSINRNKLGCSADLKNADDLERVRRLVAEADVLIENFRPGVMDRLGLGYEAVRELNPRLVYGVVTGYGPEGPWAGKPGQDLLAQALSGLTWLSGNADDPPVPMGLAVADLTAGAHLVQGILAALVRRGSTGEGGLVEVSLLESILDLQFEVTTTYLNDGGKEPKRSCICNGHAYLGAPYGIYGTADGYLALAMGDIPKLGELLDLPELAAYRESSSWFDSRDEIKECIAKRLKERPSSEWLERLEPAGYWCAEVLSWSRLFQTEAFRALDFVQEVRRENGAVMKTTRCPIRIDGEKLRASLGAPRVGQHDAQIDREYALGHSGTEPPGENNREGARGRHA